MDLVAGLDSGTTATKAVAEVVTQVRERGTRCSGSASARRCTGLRRWPLRAHRLGPLITSAESVRGSVAQAGRQIAGELHKRIGAPSSRCHRSTAGPYNITASQWDPEALQLAGIDAAQLAVVVRSPWGQPARASPRPPNLPAGHVLHQRVRRPGDDVAGGTTHDLEGGASGRQGLGSTRGRL